MSSRIDCSIMSHPTCVLYEEEGAAGSDPRSENEGAAESGKAEQPDSPSQSGASYDCVNDCMASLGIPSALAGTAVTVTCLIATAGACAIVAGGALGAFVGACAAGCDELAKER